MALRFACCGEGHEVEMTKILSLIYVPGKAYQVYPPQTPQQTSLRATHNSTTQNFWSLGHTTFSLTRLLLPDKVERKKSSSDSYGFPALARRTPPHRDINDRKTFLGQARGKIAQNEGHKNATKTQRSPCHERGREKGIGQKGDPEVVTKLPQMTEKKKKKTLCPSASPFCGTLERKHEQTTDIVCPVETRTMQES